MTFKIIAVVAAVVGVSLSAAACTVAPTSAQTTAGGDIRTAVAPAHPAPPGGTTRRRTAFAPAHVGRRTFGSGCGILSRSGPGSRASLATAPVATALSRSPGLSALAHAIRRVGLSRMLNATRAVTVFAPDNAAFRALGAGNLQALLATRPDLVKVLKFHMLAGRVTPAQLARRHVFTTVGGTKLYLARSGQSLGVNNATVTCGNVQTSNAIVYVVDKVIIPGS